MVKEVVLNDGQKRNLERLITDRYEKEGIVATGLEINWVHQFYDGEYRVNYTYEDTKNRDRNQDIYCTFCIYPETVTDLTETK